jgi:tryptophan halogenase
MKRIIIVTNEVTGLISALILKQKFIDSEIKVIASTKKNPLGSLTDTTNDFQDFMGFTGINLQDLFKSCDAALKWGSKFKNWSKDDFISTYITHPHSREFGQYLFMWGEFIKKDISSKEMWHPNVWQSLINKTHHPLMHQLNRDKLYKHLEKICSLREIQIVKDNITSVEVEKNSIKSLKGSQNYTADFYIDITGLDRKLIKHLSPEWISCKDMLSNNEATVVEEKVGKECLVYTTNTKLKHGWSQSINDYKNQTTVYYYNNKKSQSNRVGKKITFEQGYYKETFINNCCAIGMASGFIEPIHGHSLTLGINQTYLLMHHLPNANKFMRKFYNLGNLNMYENIRDLTYLTYMNNSNFNPSENLHDYLEVWKHRLPIHEDLPYRFSLYKSLHFIVLLHGLGFLKKHKKELLKEYNSMNNMLHSLAESYWLDYKKTFEFKGMPHKDYLKFHHHS